MLKLTRDEINYLIFCAGYTMGGLKKEGEPKEGQDWVRKMTLVVIPKLSKEGDKLREKGE